MRLDAAAAIEAHPAALLYPLRGRTGPRAAFLSSPAAAAAGAPHPATTPLHAWLAVSDRDFAGLARVGREEWEEFRVTWRDSPDGQRWAA